MRAVVLLGKAYRHRRVRAGASGASAAAAAGRAQHYPQHSSARRTSLHHHRRRAEGGSVQFIGTATVLIHYQGITILTDPNFLHKGDHVHLGYGLRSQRLSNRALEFPQLPPIDLVILSHVHEDHFDQLVQRQLNRDTLSSPPGRRSRSARAMRAWGSVSCQGAMGRRRLAQRCLALWPACRTSAARGSGALRHVYQRRHAGVR